MTFQALYRVLEKQQYYVFSFEDALSFFPGESRGNLKRMMARWKTMKWISPLRRGFYELTYPHDWVIPDMFMANRLYSPSYVSLETALSHYSLIPEVAMAVTSLTPKPTRRFKNRHGLFLYRTIKPRAFSGYLIEHEAGYPVLIAEPEKALVDFIYFKTLHRKPINFSEERLDMASALKSLNRKKLKAYAALYGFDIADYACSRSMR